MQVVLFAVPGAFTPTCSLKHLPGFIEKAHELKVGLLMCQSRNAALLQAWKAQLQLSRAVQFDHESCTWLTAPSTGEGRGHSRVRGSE
jgi:peroxiredoxin